MTAQESQKSFVFSGVFSMIWIGEAVITFQIKLLGGNMQVSQSSMWKHSANLTSDRSSNPCVSLVTLFFPWSLRLYSVLSTYQQLPEFQCILYSLHGLWLRVLVSLVVREL